MSFFKKKLWLVFVLILAVTVIFAALSRMGKNPLSDAVNTVLTPIQSSVAKITQSLDNGFEYLSEMKGYKQKNEELVRENRELTAQLKDIDEYREENERLKRLLKISDEMAGSQTVAARVVAYDDDNWFTYITIDKGEKHGIEVSDAVVTADGLLGQIVEVGYNWAKISTVINPESSAGVRIVRNGEIGIAEGDVKLSKINRCRLGYLISNASVIAGDILETSGLGGIYPPGIKVGKITDVRKDNMGRLDYAEIEPFIDFNNLYEVVVITQWSLQSDMEESEAQQNVDNVENVG
ncbi:MAG: rod shape-determining protein MreC [Clostridia bacterium]|nr:rod shape-determining protein MreC [Clostridia bacterium]